MNSMSMLPLSDQLRRQYVEAQARKLADALADRFDFADERELLEVLLPALSNFLAIYCADLEVRFNLMENLVRDTLANSCKPITIYKP